MTKNEILAKSIDKQVNKFSSLSNKVAFVKDRVADNQELADALVQLNFRNYELLASKHKTYELTKVYASEFNSYPTHVPDKILEAHEDIVTTFVKRDGYFIQNMPPSIKSKKRFQLMAVNDIGLSLENLWYLDEKDNTIMLNADKDVVIAAIKNNPISYRFASDELKEDMDILTLAISSPKNIDWSNFIKDELFYSPKVLALLLEFKPSKLIEHMESSKFVAGTDEHIRAVKTGIKDKPQSFFQDVFKKVSIKHPLGFFSLDSFLPYVEIIVSPMTAETISQLLDMPSIAIQKDMSHHLESALEKRKLLEIKLSTAFPDTKIKRSRKTLGRTL